MKLNPEELEIDSFDTEAAYVEQDAITVDPNHPTPATYCFVCD